MAMHVIIYIDALERHLSPFWDIHEYHQFMHDGGSSHKTKIVQKWLDDKNILVLH